MNRFAYALALMACMVWLTATGAFEPAGQEKVQDVPARDVKQGDKAKTDKTNGQAVGDKKTDAVKAVKVAADGKAAPARAQQAKAAKAVPARRVAAPAPMAPAFDANVAMLQFLPQFKQLHKAEMHFMRLVCQPTRQQFELIAADSEPALKELAQKFGQRNQNGFVIINAALVGQADDEQNDAHRLVADVVAKSVRKILAAELANRFDEEIAARMESSKQTVVLGYVAKMDKLLHLNAQQREKLIKLLNANWKYSNNRAQILNMGGEYFPVMPDADINPILNESQKRLWTGVQRGNISFGVNLNNEQEEDFQEVWDEPGQKPAPEKVKTTDKTGGTDKKGRP
jgi:hypothetical protein